MGIKKFMENAKEKLGLIGSQKETKKKSLKNLLKKLNKKKENTEKLLQTKIEKKERKIAEEEFQIIVCQIKHGNKILEKLNDK
ncbi:MAG: hypothetical protein KAJ49_03210 [Arcobacteraceae bacterium]|nr:hypothetical protein [Arcobacteraceae bacterium]